MCATPGKGADQCPPRFFSPERFRRVEALGGLRSSAVRRSISNRFAFQCQLCHKPFCCCCFSSRSVHGPNIAKEFCRAAWPNSFWSSLKSNRVLSYFFGAGHVLWKHGAKGLCFLDAETGYAGQRTSVLQFNSVEQAEIAKKSLVDTRRRLSSGCCPEAESPRCASGSMLSFLDGSPTARCTQESTWGGDRKGENAKIQVEDGTTSHKIYLRISYLSVVSSCKIIDLFIWRVSRLVNTLSLRRTVPLCILSFVFCIA